MEYKEKYIVRVPESGCWLWIGQCDKAGYGYIRDGYKRQCAHRKFYTIYKGIIPTGMYVLHKCDVRCCVNPAHLYIGTQSDNMRDAHRRGRRSSTGESNGNVKLTKEDTRQIVDLYGTGLFSQTDIGKLYGVASSHISLIIAGKVWKDI